MMTSVLCRVSGPLNVYDGTEELKEHTVNELFCFIIIAFIKILIVLNNFLRQLKVPTSDKPGVFVNFRKLLLNRCQKEFEKDQDDDEIFEKKQKVMEAAKDVRIFFFNGHCPYHHILILTKRIILSQHLTQTPTCICSQEEERERLRVELEEARDQARRRSLGNIKFIGELFKLKMLTEAIMHDCVVKLLKNHDEESLECLCRLLSTIGKDLDFEKAKVREV